jgi:cell shape-determining protein MreC
MTKLKDEAKRLRTSLGKKNHKKKETFATVMRDNHSS